MTVSMSKFVVADQAYLPLLFNNLGETVKHVFVALAVGIRNLKLHTGLDDVQRVHDQNLWVKSIPKKGRYVLIKKCLVKSKTGC